MIKLNAIGFLGKDATKNEVNGKAIINFSVAHTEKFKTAQGEQKEKTTWLECSWWSEKTGILPYLVKGTQVFIEGQPEVRTWDSNGKSGASLTVRVSMVQLLGVKVQDSQQQAQSSAVWNGANEEEVLDLPF